MKRFINIFTIVALAFACLSCSLNEDISNLENPYDFYKNEAQIRAAANGCYSRLNYIFDLRYFQAVEGASDLASTNGSSQKDAKLDISPAAPGAGTHVWSNCYTGIKFCLSTIAGIDRSDVEESVKAKYRAEIYILLSFYYYHLTSFFGDVPFYLDFVETDEDMVRVAKMGRMPADQTRQTLINILKDQVPILPQIRSSEVAENRIGAAMGWMMIAKMAAWNKAWNDVIDACKHLEAIYGDLQQYPYTDVMFRNKNTRESIFEIQHYFVEGGIDFYTPSSLAISAVVLPNPKQAGTCIFDSVTIEEIGTQATCYTPLRPTSYMKNTIQKAGTGDIRREINMCSSWNGVSFPSSRVWMGPKFWCPNVYQNKDNNNYKIFRYADALLLMAEAYCELGMQNDAIRYLNMVKTRAQIDSYSFETQIKLRGEIRDERARELFGEWQRKFDLVRWGIWYDQVLAYNTYKNIQANIRPCHEYYPIPSLQVEISGGILDNPEYKKYNLLD